MERIRGTCRHPSGALLLLGTALVFVSILAQLSVWPVHSLQRRAIRHEMKDRILSGLPESALTKFRFTQAEFEQVDFVDGGRELRAHGMMYDIVRTYSDPQGRVVIEAARDDDETELMADLGRLVAQHVAADEQGSEQRQRIVATWAPYFEPVQGSRPLMPVEQVLIHGERTAIVGRVVGAIDPGPPRSA